MRKVLFIIPSFCLILLYCNSLFSQVDSTIVSQIKAYVKQIDSLDDLDYVQNIGLIKSVTDGEILRNKVVIGGFGIYTLSNSKSDTVLRIRYHDNVDINIYKTYYYRYNKLIYSIVELKEWRSVVKTIYRKEEFYDKERILLTTLQNEESANKFAEKTRFSLYQDGIKYINNFRGRP